MPALVVDDFVSSSLVRALQATWLDANSGHWHVYDNGKKASKDPCRLPVAANVILSYMASYPISSVLNISDTFPDLEYLHGAGLHEMPSGGCLGAHLDSMHHPTKPWKREASLILYLDDVDGGELELLDSANGNVTQSIQSKSNRLVMFPTQNQWHRVNKCNSVRRSLCLFFWSIMKEGEEKTEIKSKFV